MARPPTTNDVRAAFDAEVEHIRSARELVAETLTAHGWPSAAVDRARLVVSELAANAVLHARTPFELRCSIPAALQARLEVTDWAPQTVPQMRALDRSAPGGMGLRLIAAMTSEWGVDEHPECKVVWCHMNAADGWGTTSP